MKTSWAVLSQDAIFILENEISGILVKMTLVSSLLGIGERAKKLRLKFDELSTVQIRTSSERVLWLDVMIRLY